MQTNDNKNWDEKPAEERIKFRRNLEIEWNIKANNALLGKTIEKVEYMTDKECDDMYWYKRPVMFRLSNGVWCYPSQDDEGNDGGALFMNNTLGCLPVL